MRMTLGVEPSLEQWAQRAIREVHRRVKPVETRRRRKVLVVHLDGVPFDLLQDAVSTGKMPFLSGLVRSGAYRMDKAFWGSPASTPAFQAALLYGLRHPNLPAYNWFDRELGREVRMNAPGDTLCIDRRLGLASPDSLLEDGGTTYLSLFSGHAPDTLCMTGLTDIGRVMKALLRETQGLGACVRHGGVHFLREIVRDTWVAGMDVFSWARRVRDWRHEWRFLFNHLFMISLAWSLAQKRALIDMVRGVPAVYLVFGNYDEIAHRRGPRSEQATRQLYRADARLAELYAVGRSLPEPYDLYFVTDHGHVASTPFERRFGQDIRKFLLQERAPEGLSGELEGALLQGREPLAADALGEESSPRVIDAGNFAHVYLTGGKQPLEAREIVSRHREVLGRAVSQKDIGIVALRRGAEAVAIIEGQVYTAAELPRSPLGEGFSRRAVMDLLHELPHMTTAGDLVLYGQTVGSDATVGFAWEFGSHGGLTHVETQSAVCWPTQGPADLSALGHATELHQKLSSVYRN